MMDVGGRYVANVVIGTLFDDSPRILKILDSEAVDRVNLTTVAAVCDSAMKLLWEDGVT
jgi:hypothetical protein